ncbi:MAG: F0F1 ATP synthase subunit epsilon [Candidatus Doudnabacteria bacterium]
MTKLKFRIVTPERTVLQEEVDSLSCPTELGQITILPNHVPLIASLHSGELAAKFNGQTQYFAVSGGFVEVRPGNQIIILADTAEHSDEIDIEKAEAARKRAEEDMKNAKVRNSPEYANFTSIFQKNLVRAKVARRSRKNQAGGLPSEAIFKH